MTFSYLLLGRRPARPVVVAHTMRRIGLLLWFTGALRMHKDGDGFDFVFRAWHPVTWLMLVAMLLPCALVGEKLLNVVPLRLTDFWQRNAEQLQRVTPFTRIDSLKPFDYSRVVRPAARADEQSE